MSGVVMKSEVGTHNDAKPLIVRLRRTESVGATDRKSKSLYATSVSTAVISSRRPVVRCTTATCFTRIVEQTVVANFPEALVSHSLMNHNADNDLAKQKRKVCIKSSLECNTIRTKTFERQMTQIF